MSTKLYCVRNYIGSDGPNVEPDSIFNVPYNKKYAPDYSGAYVND